MTKRDRINALIEALVDYLWASACASGKLNLEEHKDLIRAVFRVVEALGD